MIALVRATLLCTIVAASFPAVAAGQKSSSDSVNSRIVLLEHQVADLEQRVRELESVIKAQPPRARPLPASANWRDLANWRQLRRGMNMDQVRALLGEPDRVDAIAIATTWTWGSDVGSADATFDASGKLAAWSEPRQ